VSSSFQTQFSTLLFATFYLVCRRHHSCFYILRRLLGLSRRITLEICWYHLGVFQVYAIWIIYLYVRHLFTPISLPRRVDFPTVLIVISIPSSSLRYLQAINNQPLPVPAAAAASTTTIVALAVVRAYNPWRCLCITTRYTLPVACRSSFRRHRPAYQSSTLIVYQLIAAAAYNNININNSNCRLLNLKLPF